MKEEYLVKYTKKENRGRLLIESLTFDDIVEFFGNDQQMKIEKLYLFQALADNFCYNEDFFSGRYLTLEMFQRFLQSLDNYEILCLAFEIDNGIYFKIEENQVTILVKSTNEELINQLLSTYSTKTRSTDYLKLITTSKKYVYYKKTPEVQIISNNKLWNNFDRSVN
jgi:hypothetical protein